MKNEFFPIELFLNFCIVKFDDVKIDKINDDNLFVVILKNLAINSLEESEVFLEGENVIKNLESVKIFEKEISVEKIE